MFDEVFQQSAIWHIFGICTKKKNNALLIGFELGNSGFSP